MLKNQGRFKKKILTMHGAVTFERTMLIGIDKENTKKLEELTGESSIFPLDQSLGIDKIPFKMTPRMVLAVAREGVRAKSYREAAITLKDRFDCDFSADLVRNVTDHVGQIVWEDDLRQARAAEKWHSNNKIDRRKRSHDPEDIIVIGTDGAYLDTREESWKETKIGLCYNLKDMYTWKCANGDIGRRITRKDLVAYIGKAEDFKNHFLALGLRNDIYSHNQIISITDGAPWIKNMVSALFPGAVHIVDLYHVKEKVGKFAKLHVRGKHKKEKWVEAVNERIEAGAIEDALKLIEPYCNKSNKDDDTNLYSYIEKRKDQMRYAEYKAKGYPVGSGAQESANKYGMQDRMTLQGQRWLKERGQGVLACKCRFESNRWDTVEQLVFKKYETPMAVIKVVTL